MAGIWLGERDLTRRTWAAGAWASGVFTKGASTDTTIRGTWRPMPARQVELLPEGDRLRDPRVVHVFTQLTMGVQGTGTTSDHLSPDGGTTWYELLTETDCSDDTAFLGMVNHWRYTALRIMEAG